MTDAGPLVTAEIIMERLPSAVQFDEQIAWLNVNKYRDGYEAGYLHCDGLYEPKLHCIGRTPLTALRRLEVSLDRLQEVAHG